MPEESSKPPKSALWQSVAPHYTVVAAISAALSFAFMACMYDEFYREFGISSTDVGMSRADVLTRSWGTIIVLAALVLATVLLTWLALGLLRKLIRRFSPRRGERRFSPFKWAGEVVYVLAILLVLFLAGHKGNQIVSHKGKIGAEGKAVMPIRYTGLMLFDVRAQPVTEIVSVTDASVSISVSGLTYLGNNDRSFVLYCVEDQRLLKISMERFTLRTSPEQDAVIDRDADCDTRGSEGMPPIKDPSGKGAGARD